jgi:hypothetical protein
MPAIELVIKVVIFGVLLYLFAYVITSGKMDTKSYANLGGYEVKGLRKHFEYSDEEKGYIAYFIFGIFWYLEFLNALGNFVVSYAVVGWYYTPNDENGNKTSHNWCGICWGYVWGLTVHSGSLAAGSFLIAVFRFIRLIISALQAEARKEGNAVMKCIADCLQCIVTCMQKIVEFINKNAYIDICINSNNFCQAGKDALTFIATNAPAISILNGACTVFSMSGSALISCGTATLTYLACTSVSRWTDEDSPHHVASPRFVAIIAFIGALVVALSFMTIFDQTADTLLFTYAWNKSKSHNSVSKFAPKGLQELVGYEMMKKPEEKPAKKEEPKGFWQTMFGGSGEQEPLIKK